MTTFDEALKQDKFLANAWDKAITFALNHGITDVSKGTVRVEREIGGHYIIAECGAGRFELYVPDHDVTERKDVNNGQMDESADRKVGADQLQG